jgi:putative hydrolase of HD superfamily
MFAEHEFENFVVVDGRTVTVTAAELQERYNDDAHDPRDGELIKRADNLAAFVEAYAGIRNGSTSQDLQYAKVKIRGQEQVTHYAGLNFGEIYSDFD